MLSSVRATCHFIGSRHSRTALSRHCAPSQPRIPLLQASRLKRTYASVHAGELQFGQPVYETHPHLLKPGELTPGITAIEYAQRRSRLAEKLPKNAVAIVAASDIKYRSGNVFYEFHQDPDFFYLTGFNEPDALAIIARNNDAGNDHTFHLYVREKDPKAEIWDGARSGTQAALDVFNADETGDINKVSDVVPAVIKGAGEVYTDLRSPDTRLSPISRFLHGPSTRSEGFAKLLESNKVRALRPVINELRVFKSEAEIKLMRKAGQASGRAFTEAMGKDFRTEKDLDAFLDYRIKSQGCDGASFEPVVAGGPNALSIHYVRNDNVLRDGQLVLVDGGGEYGGYIADITRTWPVNGKFSGPQKDLYEALLKVQRTCISLCRENADLSLDKLHEIAEHSLQGELQQLGFDVSANAMEILFPHHLGHYIGLDVHDSVGYPRRHKLRSGQCITVEPGVYVPMEDRWPKHFQGIGIRIEDSVCIKEESPFVFTTEAVKEVADIEALRN